MEFPHLGKQCAESSCQKLDFLPVKCDACEKIFCHEHMSYMGHNCASAYKKDVQVPVCPLCNKPIPVRRGEPPDIAVGAHIDTDCQSDPAKNKRKVFTNKCSMKGCKGKEIVRVVCNECSLNFCLRHRHTADHKCQGRQAATRNLAAQAATARLAAPTQTPAVTSVQGSLSEDEALARAIQLSMMEEKHTNKSTTPEEQLAADAALARAIAESERTARRPITSNTPSNSRSNCAVS
ncbi:zinc finger, AN1-type domain [Homalodisca vitripennis]|nr:zinc finger, AN1-type domain [Homalodisca vitripennis]